MFPVVNANLGFVSIKIETVSKVIIDDRRMLKMSGTKLTLFIVNNRNIRAMCKIYTKLTIKTSKWRCSGDSIVNY